MSENNKTNLVTEYILTRKPFTNEDLTMSSSEQQVVQSVEYFEQENTNTINRSSGSEEALVTKSGKKMKMKKDKRPIETAKQYSATRAKIEKILSSFQSVHGAELTQRLRNDTNSAPNTEAESSDEEMIVENIRENNKITQQCKLNYYAKLSEIDDTGDESFPTLERNKRKRKIAKNTSNEKQNKDEEKQNKTKYYKPPPILVENLNVNELLKSTKNKNIDNNDIKIKHNKTKSTIYCKKLVDQKQIMTIMTEEGKEAHSFTPTEEKPVSVVLSGIQGSLTAQDVHEDITNRYEDIKIIKVLTLETPTSRENMKKLDKFIVQFAPGTTRQQIYQIRGILSQVPKWEDLKKRLVTQCRRCQRFGHAASNCAHFYRCVKCTRKHQPGECQKLNTEDPDCVNCGKTGHPANYTQCPEYIKFAEARATQIQENAEKAMKKTKRPPVFFTSKPYTPGVSFANMVQNDKTQTRNNNTQSTPNDNNTGIDFIENETQNLFGCGLADMLQKINNFIPTHKQLQTKHEKQASMFNFFMQLCRGN